MDATSGLMGIRAAITALRQYDNAAGYKRPYPHIKKKLATTTEQLRAYGEAAAPSLHALLRQEETWSCLFALEILKELRSEKSIGPLIRFIKKNENGEYWKSCDEAAAALQAIGKPAAEPLLEEVRANFGKKVCYGYLVEALTGIKDDAVYGFMADTVRDYLRRQEWYDGWLGIHLFVLNFDVQGKREALPLLRQLLTMDHLSSFEQWEIRSTIEAIVNPDKAENVRRALRERFRDDTPGKKTEINEKAMLEQAIDLEEKGDYDAAQDCIARILEVYPKSYHALFLAVRIGRRQGKPNVLMLSQAREEARKQHASPEVLALMEKERERTAEAYADLSATADDDLELNFQCADCGKRQNLKPGKILVFGDLAHPFFENEIICRHCASHSLQLTKEGTMELMGQSMRMMIGEASGVRHVEKEMRVENRQMPVDKAYPYLLKRIQQQPRNGELHLRAGNIARKLNRYAEAIRHYEKAEELNPALLAVYINLTEIYSYRYQYYKMREAKAQATAYLVKLRERYESRDFSSATLHDSGRILGFIGEQERLLGLPSNHTLIPTEEVANHLRNAATHDLGEVERSMKERIRDSEEKGKELLREHKGVIVRSAHHIFDKKTNESRRVNVSTVMPIEKRKACICGSEKYLSKCCSGMVKKNLPFAINPDGVTYSVVDHTGEQRVVAGAYAALLQRFKGDVRFYCDKETAQRALFLYYGDRFFTDPELGTLVFGTFELKKTFTGKTALQLFASSQNRFRALRSAVQEHVDL